MRLLLVLGIVLLSQNSKAQFNFWHSQIQSNKCLKVAPSCLAHLNNGCTSSGIYLINNAGVPTKMYCDQKSAGGGWTLISSTWIPAFQSSVDSKIVSLGQNIASAAPHSFTSMRIYCKSTARYIDRYRTASSSTTNLNIFSTGNSFSGSETRIAGDTDVVPANWTPNGQYTELHNFMPGTRRYVLRVDDIHCADEYASIGGEVNNPRLGQEGRIFIR